MLKACGLAVHRARISFGKLLGFYPLPTGASKFRLVRTFFVHKLSTADLHYKQASTQAFLTYKPLYVDINAHYPPSLMKLIYLNKGTAL
jgi:hypothetical protein